MKKTIIITLAVLLFCSQAYAAPAITSAPQTIEHKKDTIISGSGFGTKSQAAPLKWDDFENGTVGAQVIPNNGWTYWAQLGGVTYTDINQRTGSRRSTYHDVTYTSPAIGRYGTWVELYASYYVRHNITKMGESGGPKNIKEFKIYGDGGAMGYAYNSDPEFGIEISSVDPPTSFAGRFQANYREGYSAMGWNIGLFTNDQWIRREVWIRITDELGQRFKIWENARVRLDCPTPDDFPCMEKWTNPETGKWECKPGTSVGPYMGDWDGKFDEIWFFPFIRGGSTGYSQFDDVYIDTTPARVELGDKSTFSSCTHREIQIPTAWSSGSITFTANQGSFANGATAYLYVVDENGNVNSQGYPVKFGTAQALEGDVNSDGKVDIKDLILVAKDFGKTVGFNPNCDLNKDNKVDIKDLIIVAKNFGKKL